MEAEGDVNVPDRVLLDSKPGSPFAFTVAITPRGEGLARHVAVVGPEPATGARMVREYRLPSAQQDAYSDFFEQLARDFGTRIPRSRVPSETPVSGTPLTPLLTESLSPDVLYGYGDPAVTRVSTQPGEDGDVWYYLLATSNDAPDSFPIARSRDLQDWRMTGFVFPKGSKPGWATDGLGVSDYWAPELHRLGDRFLVCFAAREKDGALAIGMASALRPDGPFIAADQPLLRGSVIDPHILVDHDGDAFLFWKEDTNDLWPSLLCELLHEHDPDGRLAAELFPCLQDQRTAAFVRTLWPWLGSLRPMERFFAQQTLIEAASADFPGFRRRLEALLERETEAATRQTMGELLRLARTPIYAQRLAADGLSLLGERTVVLENDRTWEGHLVEGVWVREHQGRYYMFYSANDFSTPDYGLGVAIATSPLGPYRKTDEPLLGSTAQWLGPGHASVANGPDGQPRLFLHAFFPGKTGYKAFRSLMTVPVTFQDDRVVLG